MGTNNEEQKLCAVCLKNTAIADCDGCRRPLCKRCRRIEIFRTTGEEISIKSFCPECLEEQESSQAKGQKVFGLGQVTEMVNNEQGKLSGFKVKLKIN